MAVAAAAAAAVCLVLSQSVSQLVGCSLGCLLLLRTNCSVPLSSLKPPLFSSILILHSLCPAYSSSFAFSFRVFLASSPYYFAPSRRFSSPVAPPPPLSPHAFLVNNRERAQNQSNYHKHTRMHSEEKRFTPPQLIYIIIIGLVVAAVAIADGRTHTHTHTHGRTLAQTNRHRSTSAQLHTHTYQRSRAHTSTQSNTRTR